MPLLVGVLEWCLKARQNFLPVVGLKCFVKKKCIKGFILLESSVRKTRSTCRLSLGVLLCELLLALFLIAVKCILCLCR